MKDGVLLLIGTGIANIETVSFSRRQLHLIMPAFDYLSHVYLCIRRIEEKSKIAKGSTLDLRLLSDLRVRMFPRRVFL